jgi:uncharacterized membrane protein
MTWFEFMVVLTLAPPVAAISFAHLMVRLIWGKK